jgi:predicted RNase H-like HicB family nuclease
LELDVASQGETEEEALANLKEALELHFEPPHGVVGRTPGPQPTPRRPADRA